jgi:uroporphyrin-III C-methyltransferase
MIKNEIDIPELYILGAGPGDPELITMKGYKIFTTSQGCIVR